ncbi:MAG TPA: hypothetical protein VHB79_32875 [Polyangiaceae bacterium]|nr:hypothetical protein [Polyangiaceae bacterium]
MFTTRTASYLAALVATLASVACSAPEARPVSAAAAPVECRGGIVRNDDDAARFDGCETVVGDLQIASSDLTDLSQLGSVRRVTGKLSVTNNQKLISLAGLKGVERAGSVEIHNNPLLCAYFGLLSGLEQVDHSLELSKNRGLSQNDVRAMLERVDVRGATVNGELGRQASL